MKILAIDASAPVGRAALVSGGVIEVELEFGGGRSRGGGAASAIEELAKSGASKGIAGVVVGTGPGSYTGLRSSIAAAWGFALARNVPLSGVSSLLALGVGEYLAIGDARRGEFYWARVRDGIFLDAPVLVDRTRIEALLSEFPGLPRCVPSPAGIPGEELAVPRMEVLASLAKFDDRLPGGLCEPIYLKPPHITQSDGPRRSGGRRL